MIHSHSLIAWLSLATLLTTLFAAPNQSRSRQKDSSQEPFRSFGMLDNMLTLLTNQQNALKALEPGLGNIRRRRAACNSINHTATEIEHIADGLERLYEGRHQDFGIRIFKLMRIRAQEVRQGIRSVAKAQTRNALGLATKNLDRGIVSLVVQFQAASGGYGATRCSPGAWTCCEPKRSEDLLQSEQVACKWECISTAKTCAGFVGPHILRP
jgi:hypothetical protein